jgi:hypothetical protein
MFFDLVKAHDIIAGNQRESTAYVSGPARSTDSVNIVVLVVWNVIVDYQRKAFDVNTSCGHISRYEYMKFALLELLYGIEPFTLGNVSMESLRGIPLS